MKQYELTFTERGEKYSFETRAFIRLESDSIPQILSQFLLELSKVYEQKVQEAYIRGKRENESINDDDIPF